MHKHPSTVQTIALQHGGPISARPEQNRVTMARLTEGPSPGPDLPTTYYLPTLVVVQNEWQTDRSADRQIARLSANLFCSCLFMRSVLGEYANSWLTYRIRCHTEPVFVSNPPRRPTPPPPVDPAPISQPPNHPCLHFLLTNNKKTVGHGVEKSMQNIR